MSAASVVDQTRKIPSNRWKTLHGATLWVVINVSLAVCQGESCCEPCLQASEFYVNEASCEDNLKNTQRNPEPSKPGLHSPPLNHGDDQIVVDQTSGCQRRQTVPSSCQTLPCGCKKPAETQDAGTQTTSSRTPETCDASTQCESKAAGFDPYRPAADGSEPEPQTPTASSHSSSEERWAKQGAEIKRYGFHTKLIFFSKNTCVSDRWEQRARRFHQRWRKRGQRSATLCGGRDASGNSRHFAPTEAEEGEGRQTFRLGLFLFSLHVHQSSWIYLSLYNINSSKTFTAWTIIKYTIHLFFL